MRLRVGYFAASPVWVALVLVSADFGANTPRRHRTTIPPITRTHPARTRATSPVDRFIALSSGMKRVRTGATARTRTVRRGGPVPETCADVAHGFDEA